ncbi:retrovirus-related pol polyprotein from transposon TNT 1-94, partial [Tanacetum coccineum]
MKCKKEDHRTLDHDMYIASLKISQNYKAQPYQYASPSKQILKSKAKPYPLCTHNSFNDHHLDDCRNYLECEICRSYDHFTPEHNRVIQVRGGVLVESSQSSESSIRRHIREPIWYMDSGCSRSMTGFKSYMYKYVEQPGPKFNDKQGTNVNANKEIMLISPRRYDVYVLDMSSLTPMELASFLKPQKVKCLHLLHMDLFGPVSLMSINHEKYTLVIVDEMVGNKNDVKVKQIRTDNGTEFKNSELETKRKNRTLIEATGTMLNESVLSKQFWTEAVRIDCYTQNRSIIIKRHDKTPYEIFRESIPDISYFHIFGCLVFIHNHKDDLGKFDAKADDGYFLGYSFNSKAFRVFNTRRQQIEETYHVTFDESIKAIKFTNTSVDEMGIDDSSRYPPDEFAQEDDPSRQYQANFDFSHYIIPHGRSLIELMQENHVPKVIAPNEQDNPHTENVEGMLTRSMATKLIAVLASEYLFANFLFEIEPKKTGSQEEVTDYVETFAPVARMEAIRIFLIVATYMNFIVFQMDVKSAFLNGKLKEEQPFGFENSEFPDHVYKLDKALYGLKQAPRACSSVKTPMVPPNNLGPDLAGKPVNETLYRRMIGLLMYLTATRLDIQFSTCLCARYHATLKESYLIVVKRIFRKSTSSTCQILGGKIVCWSAKKQQSMAMSLSKAEYVAAAGCC